MNKATALDVASQYATAIAARDGERMHALRATTYVLDFVHLDAFQASPLAATEGKDVYRSLFTAFPDSDFEVTRTITGEEVVVQEWIFTGTNTGRFELLGVAGSASRGPTGNTVHLRGASIYDISGGLVQRETIYLNNATLAVEKGGNTMNTGRTEQNPRSVGRVVIATQVITSGPGSQRARTIILLLAGSCALMMTGYGMVMPVFAKRLGELGSGVEALGFMTMAFAIAQFLLAPFMGELSDRFGRRPFVLIALSGIVVANVAYLFAQSTALYIAIRFFQGAASRGAASGNHGRSRGHDPRTETRAVGRGHHGRLRGRVHLRSGYGRGALRALGLCGPLCLFRWAGGRRPAGGPYDGS